MSQSKNRSATESIILRIKFFISSRKCVLSHHRHRWNGEYHVAVCVWDISEPFSTPPASSMHWMIHMALVLIHAEYPHTIAMTIRRTNGLQQFQNFSCWFFLSAAWRRRCIFAMCAELFLFFALNSGEIFLYDIGVCVMIYAFFTPFIYGEFLARYPPLNKACVFCVLITRAGRFH